MPVFVEDPAHLSKSRLRSDLIAHNVALPRAESKKEVYVGLYLKHIDQKNAADFSSDEEDQVEKVEEEAPEMLDPSGLTDDDLKATLLKHGVIAGPIVASTRALYESKLKKLLQPEAQQSLNGAEDAALYSDSEEEEDGDEEEDKESGSEQAGQEMVLQLEQTPETSQRACAPRHWEPSPKRNAGNVVESSTEWSRARCSQIPTGLSRTSSVAQPTGLGSGLPREPVTDIAKEMFPGTVPTPTGICATRRRSIKGAAGRPVVFKYPDTPVSPMTLERREVERRLVPIYIQILVFLIVTCLLYLIYLCVEDNSYNPFGALLDNLDQGSDGEDGLLLEPGTQDTLEPDPLSGQETV
ncbi:LEM domain-containing protein 1 [Diretmus argenteus]